MWIKRIVFIVVGLLVVIVSCISGASSLSTQLFKAIDGGDSAQVEKLIKSGVNVNDTNKDNETPLYASVSQNNLRIIELLISSGADIEMGAEGESPLFLAVTLGYRDIAAFLIGRGADVNTTNMFSYTPLHFTAQKYLSDIAELLLKKGANPNAASEPSKVTPLHEAVNIFVFDTYDPKKDYLAVPRMLIKYGANPNLKDSEGHTPLESAEFFLRMQTEKPNEYYKMNDQQTSDLKRFIAFLKPLTK